MKIINDKLFIEFHEAISAGFSQKYLWKARSTGIKTWHFIDDPADRRRVLIAYDEIKEIGYPGMKEKYREQIKTWLRKEVGCKHDDNENCTCGDPHAYMALQPIREMIHRDDKAEAFYMAYRYDGPTGRGQDSLPPQHIEKYTRQASLLNMLLDARKNKKAIKEKLGIRLDVFHERVIDLNRLDGYGLPETYTNLMKRLREYEKESYATLIDWRFGNSVAKKVKDEACESLLLELISHPNQYDDVYVEMAYNKWAAENGYKVIDRSTVGVWRRKLEYLIIGKREGNAAWYDKFGKEINGYRPTQPLFMTEHDDNYVDLQFIDPNDTGSSKYHHKYIAIVVTDSYNDYVLGYAYSETISEGLVRAAWLNAMYHIRQLTGGWYLPHELKTDNWNKKALTSFYESIGHYHPTPVGSKRGRGYIEQFFGSQLWKRCLKAGANNYTGNNLTAKFRGVNTEEVDRNKPQRPTLQEGQHQVDLFFNRLRLMPGKDGKSKQQQWLEAFCEMPEADKRAINDMQFLSRFGIRHEPKNGSKNTITNGGIEPTINKIAYRFSIPPALYLQNVGKKVDVIYDPYDMSRVLITDNEHLRFIANEARLGPRAMADFNRGDRLYLNALLEEKKQDAIMVANAAKEREQVLRRRGIDPNAILESGAMIKELRMQATLEAGYDDRPTDPIDQM